MRFMCFPVRHGARDGSSTPFCPEKKHVAATLLVFVVASRRHSSFPAIEVSERNAQRTLAYPTTTRGGVDFIFVVCLGSAWSSSPQMNARLVFGLDSLKRGRWPGSRVRCWLQQPRYQVLCTILVASLVRACRNLTACPSSNLVRRVPRRRAREG